MVVHEKAAALVLCLTFLLTPSFSALAQTPAVSRNRLLFNASYPMGENEEPDDMVTLYSLSIVVSLAAIQLDREAASFARAMFNAMIDDGITNYLVVSGYRTYAKQQQLYADKYASYQASGYSDSEAEVLAKFHCGRPGNLGASERLRHGYFQYGAGRDAVGQCGAERCRAMAQGKRLAFWLYHALSQG